MDTNTKRFAVGCERLAQSILETREPAVDIAREHFIRIFLLLRQRGHEPRESRTLAAADAATLLAQPGQVHLEIAARPRIAGQIAEPSPQLCRDVLLHVWPECPLPAPKPPQCDAEIVECLGVGRVGQPVAGARRVGEMAERHRPHDAVTRFSEIVDARGHGNGTEVR